MGTYEDGTFAPSNTMTNEEVKTLLNKVSESGKADVLVEEVFTVTSYDGYEVPTQITTLQDSSDIKTVVIYNDGSNLSTYKNLFLITDKWYIYYTAVLANGIVNENTALVTYSDRGVIHSEEPGNTISTNEEEYLQHIPSNHIRDLEAVYNHVKNDKRYENTNIILAGISEGTSTISNALVKRNLDVKGVVVSGYMSTNVKDMIEYQYIKAPYYNFTLNVNMPFADELTKEYLETLGSDIYLEFTGADEIKREFSSFEELDINGDGVITVEDTKELYSDFLFEALRLIEEGGESEIAVLNHMNIEWHREHFALNNVENYLQIDVPVHIIQGEYDTMTPVTELYDAIEVFEKANKDNITYEVAPKADHNLNYSEYIITGEIPDTFQLFFDAISEMTNN